MSSEGESSGCLLLFNDDDDDEEEEEAIIIVEGASMRCESGAVGGEVFPLSFAAVLGVDTAAAAFLTDTRLGSVASTSRLPAMMKTVSCT